MTITNEKSKTAATGTGSAGQVVSITFDRIPETDGSDIEAFVRDDASPPAFTAVDPADYTVDNDNDTVTFDDAIAITDTIIIRSVVTNDQQTDYISTGPFPAETAELNHDKAVKLVQQVNETLQRVPTFQKHLNFDQDSLEFDTTIPFPLAGNLVRINDDADGLELIDENELLLDFTQFDTDGISPTDEIPFNDVSETPDATNKITFANLEATLNHDSLAGFVSDEHIDHTAVDIATGNGLSGGGDISATRTLALDYNGLTAAAVASGDELSFGDIDDSDTVKKITFANLEAAIDHDNLTGFVANEHVDHSSVSISSGNGLSGGGDITATRTLALDYNGLTTAVPATGDELSFGDIDDSDTVRKVTIDNLLDNALVNDQTAIHDDVAGEIAVVTEKVTPVNGDFLLIEDSADSNNKKRVQIGNLPSVGGGETNTASNVGTNGVGVFDGKVGVDLQFRNINSLDSGLTVALDATDNDIDVSLNPNGLTAAAVASGDEFVFADVDDSNNAKKITFANIESTLSHANISGTTAVANGGTGQTTATAAFDALDPLTTKGDIIVHDGTNSVRLPIGTDGQVLTAASGQTEGLEWAAAGGGGSGTKSFIHMKSSTTKNGDIMLFNTIVENTGGGKMTLQTSGSSANGEVVIDADGIFAISATLDVTGSGNGPSIAKNRTIISTSSTDTLSYELRGSDETPHALAFTGFFTGGNADAAEASSTSTVINATAHVATVGQSLKFTSGTLSGEEQFISSVTANTITVGSAFSGAPSAADTFETGDVIRPVSSSAQSNGPSLVFAIAQVLDLS